MLYGTIKKLLSSEYKQFDDTVLVESPFRETTRNGKQTSRLVQLGLTSRTFIIASEQDITGKSTTSSEGTPLCPESCVIEILSLYPWESVKLTVFKRSKKQSIKASFVNNGTRYFELRDIPKKKIFWSLWCTHIKELNSSKKKWPFSPSSQKKWPLSLSSLKSKKQQCLTADCNNNCFELRFIKHSEKQRRAKWTNKYLYLGSQREVEDKIRPVPVPGLGRAEEIKLLYLKPRYFGCWEQSEHWVQCGHSSLEIISLNE